MRNFVAKILLSILSMPLFFVAVAAEQVTFQANSPLTVAVGEAFRVEFALNATPEQNTFKAPSFEGFDVLAGPAESKGESIQVSGGNMTRTTNYTISYVLLPQKAGNATVEAAEIAVDGTTYRTKPLLIEVVDEGTGTGAGAGAGRQGQQQQQRDAESIEAAAQNRIAKDDILLRAIVSRTSVYKGEPLRVTFKLYERVSVVGYDGVKFPSFNGFWAQELNMDNAKRRQRETYNGKVYETVVVMEHLLYPQQAGTLTIDPAELTAIAQVVVQGRRRIDPIFGAGHEVVNVPRKVQSARIDITVKPLPAGAPAGFSGAVGNFTLEATLPPGQQAANSAATYVVKIAGTGNLTFVQAPKLPLPASFEQYNVKTTESINASAAGISGYRQFEYPFIARAEGTYDLSPVEFCYFDPARMQYIVLRSKDMQLEITPDANGGSEAPVVQGRGMSKEEVKLLGRDIRFIKLGAAQLRPVGEPFLFNTAWWVLLPIVVGLFAAVYTALHKRIRESQNVALVRGRRANKVALQRLGLARRYMQEQNRHAFYEEMLRALWGYMGDKFNIPVAGLTKESVREELLKSGVSSDEAQHFTSIVTKCDEAQYSPAASAQMGEVYGAGVELISRLEAVIKR